MPVAQSSVDHRPDAVRIAQHFVIPETQNAVSFGLNDFRATNVIAGFMLPTIDLNHEPRPVSGEIGDEVPDRNLAPEMLVRKTLTEQAPQLSLCVRHISAKSARTPYRAFRWIMLHSLRSTMNITPPQPLPIEGRG